MNNATKILVSLSETYSARTHELADRTGLTLEATRRTLRTLDRAGFVFCNDEYAGRERGRGNGRYASAIWAMNCESSAMTATQATEALNKCKTANGNGGAILCQMDLAC